MPLISRYIFFSPFSSPESIIQGAVQSHSHPTPLRSWIMPVQWGVLQLAICQEPTLNIVKHTYPYVSSHHLTFLYEHFIRLGRSSLSTYCSTHSRGTPVFFFQSAAPKNVLSTRCLCRNRKRMERPTGKRFTTGTMVYTSCFYSSYWLWCKYVVNVLTDTGRRQTLIYLFDWFIDLFSVKSKLYVSVKNWSIDWSIDWLIDYVSLWSFDWLVDWLKIGFIDWSVDWLIDLSIDWLIDYVSHWSFGWLIDWLIGWLIEDCFIWSIDWLIDWLRLSLVVRLIGWLIDFVTEKCFGRFYYEITTKFFCKLFPLFLVWRMKSMKSRRPICARRPGIVPPSEWYAARDWAVWPTRWRDCDAIDYSAIPNFPVSTGTFDIFF